MTRPWRAQPLLLTANSLVLTLCVQFSPSIEISRSWFVPSEPRFALPRTVTRTRASGLGDFTFHASSGCAPPGCIRTELERGLRGQRGERGGRGGGGMPLFGPPQNEFALLGVPAVQKELDLSEDQKASAQELVESYREDQQEARRNSGLIFGELRDLSRAEQREKMAEFGKKQAEANRKLHEKYQAKLAEAFKPEQVKRFKQLTLQAAGVQALRTEDVAKTLKLSDEQQEQTAKVLQSGFGGGRGGFARRG